jgi:putative membrane protein
MRWIYLAVIVVFAVCTLIFVIQNREIVSIDFLNLGVRAPLALVIAVFYLLGAVTGGSLYALLRKSVQGSKLHGV